MEAITSKIGVQQGGKMKKKKESAAITAHTQLIAVHLDKNGKELGRRVIKDRVVTNAFVKEIVDVLQGASGTFDLYKYHRYGISTVAEGATQTNVLSGKGPRRVGTQAQGASSNIYVSVATITATGIHAITEHGLFNASTGGNLMDRTLFAVINVNSADKIQFTFSITFSSGG